jgi:hypothetical protein
MHLKASYDALLQNIVNRKNKLDESEDSSNEQLVQAKIEIELLKRELHDAKT